MIAYDQLRLTLEKLEAGIPGSVPTRSFFSEEVRTERSPVQGYVLDTSTAKKQLPVLVAIGSNYTQGVQRTPRDFLGRANAVENQLDGCRRSLANALADYARRGALWEAKGAAASATLAIPEDCHLVLTNFCLWITKRLWQRIRPQTRADLLANNPPLRGKPTTPGQWAHLTELAAALAGHEVVWVGHGIQCEVFALFRQFISSVPGARWLLTPDLAFHYDYTNWDFLR
jgi:hypothetical protein